MWELLVVVLAGFLPPSVFLGEVVPGLDVEGLEVGVHYISFVGTPRVSITTNHNTLN